MIPKLFITAYTVITICAAVFAVSLTVDLIENDFQISEVFK